MLKQVGITAAMAGALDAHGVPEPLAAGQVLGHSQIALTARYSHILADRRSVAAGRIEQALFGE